MKSSMGDNIPETPSKNPGQDNWRVRIAMARLWRGAVNRHGGNVTLVHLPDLGIHGNTHFAFSDTNNVQIADLLSQFLAEKHLDDGCASAMKDTVKVFFMAHARSSRFPFERGSVAFRRSGRSGTAQEH